MANNPSSFKTYFCYCFAYTYIPAPRVYLVTTEAGRRHWTLWTSHWRLRAAMWVLGIKPGPLEVQSVLTTVEPLFSSQSISIYTVLQIIHVLHINQPLPGGFWKTMVFFKHTVNCTQSTAVTPWLSIRKQWLKPTQLLFQRFMAMAIDLSFLHWKTETSASVSYVTSWCLSSPLGPRLSENTPQALKALS